MHLYVAANASAGGDGSESSPFATINAARKSLRKALREGTVPAGGAVVHIAEGDYYQTGQITFESEDSGMSPEAPVYYVADGEVRLIGGFSIDLENDFIPTAEGDAVYGENVVKYIAPEGTFALENDQLPISGHSTSYISSDLYNSTPYFTVSLDEEPMELCRWPNADEGYATVSGAANDVSALVSTSSLYTLYDFEITCDEMDTSLWSDDDIYIHGYWGTDYADLKTTGVITGKNSIKANYPTYQQAKTGQRFYASNAPEMLDSPGEWYIDRENDVLYLYPTKQTGTVVVGTNNSTLIYAKALKNVVFDGINIVGGRTNAYHMVNSCKNVTIKNCRINNVNGTAIRGSGINLAVNNCEISHTGSGGVNFQGGDFINQVESGNVVKNCSLHDMGRWKKCYSPAVSLDGYGAVCENNDIYNIAHTAVMMTGFEHKMRYNDVHNVVSETSDMGAVYVRANPLRRGTVIEYNYFHDLSSDSTVKREDIAAIFFDDVCAGYKAHHNIFKNIDGRTIKSNGGRENIVTNNVFIENRENGRYGCVCIAKDADTGEFYVTSGASYTKYWGFVTADNAKYVDNGLYKEFPFTKFEGIATYFEDDPLWAKRNVFKDNYQYNCTKDFYVGDEVDREYILSEASENEIVESTVIGEEEYQNILNNDYSYYGINFAQIGKK